MSDQCKFISKLSGSRILILGGSSGIGYAAAECLLEHDAAAIIISSSNPSKVAEKVSSLQKSYPSKASRVSGHACNVGDQASLEGNLKALLDAATDNSSKKLDHVIHTAGDPLKPLPIETIDMPTLVQAGMVRFFSAIMLCKLAPNYMSEGPRASITLTTGSIGERPRKGWSAPVGYSSGLHGVMRGAALDLAPLRVNLISPGAVNTELWDTFVSTPAETQKLMETLKEEIPTGRVADPRDVAESYLYCVKDENLTGSMLSTNGGALLV